MDDYKHLRRCPVLFSLHRLLQVTNPYEIANANILVVTADRPASCWQPAAVAEQFQFTAATSATAGECRSALSSALELDLE